LNTQAIVQTLSGQPATLATGRLWRPGLAVEVAASIVRFSGVPVVRWPVCSPEKCKSHALKHALHTD